MILADLTLLFQHKKNKMKLKEVKELYKSKGVESSTIERAINIDETPTKKYVNYLLKQNMRGYSIYDVYSFCKYFEKYLPYIKNKDIYSKEYDNISDLRLTIEGAKVKHELKKIDKKTAGKIFIIKETDDYILLYPKNYRVASKYGYNTRWCVTSSESYYNDYKETLVYLLIKRGVADRNYQKVAFHKRKHSFIYTIYNADDSSVGMNHLMSKMYNVKIDWQEIEDLYLEFCNRNKYGWIKKFLPWTMRYKVGR